MKIRTLAIPVLVAATLALGATGTASAHSGNLSIHYDRGYDDHPRYSHDHGYYKKHRDRRHGKHARKHFRKHLKRHHRVHGHRHDGYGHRDEHSRYNRHHTGSHHDRHRHNTRSRIGIGYTGHL